MKKVIGIVALAASVFVIAAQVSAFQGKPKPAYGPTYTKVQAVFDKNCVGCHGVNGRGRINLTSYETLMKGGEDGAIIVPKNPMKSALVQAIKHTQGFRSMPPGRELSAADVKLVEGWVKSGAKSNK